MSSVFRVFGKRIELPAESTRWKFEIRPGGWMIAEASQGQRVRVMVDVSPSSGGSQKLSASVRGYLWSAEKSVLNPAGRAIGAGASRSRRVSGQGTEADLKAQFPGKVRKVLVHKAEAVTEGQALLLIEAMKMEFTIRAPFSGIIRNLSVVEGQQVVGGELFLDLEPLAEVSSDGA